MIEKLKIENRKLKIYYYLLAVCCLISVSLYSCSGPKEKIYKKALILMDTLVTINVVSDSEKTAEKAMDKAFAEIDKLDKLLNFFNEKSELSHINKNSGMFPVTVSLDTLDIIEKALQASEKTGGAFDATIGPVIALWDFPNNPVKPPPAAAIKEKLRLVNYKWVVIDKVKSTVYLKEKGMLLDLGGIAKGYAADRAVEALKVQGIKSGLVSVAGDIKAFGLKPGGDEWVIGIKHPRQKNKEDEIIATVKLRDTAISTSGDYERYFIADGKRYHHILDPKTGYPAEGCQSISIITKDGFNTDAFSTGIFVLGPERGMQLLKETGFDGVIRDTRGNTQITPGLKDKIEFKKDN